MNIAQLAPLRDSVPSPVGGRTEQTISYLTEALVRQGHDVTLFASGDSITSARLVATCPQSLRLASGISNSDAPLITLMERAFSTSQTFDLIHSHLEFLPFPLARRSPTPVLSTLHTRLDPPELLPVYRKFAEMPLISLSAAQREPLAWANWHRTIYPGLPTDLFSPCYNPGRYLAFLGRMAPDTALDQAITLSLRTGIPLRIGATVDPTQLEYYQQVIEPLLDNPLIELVGELTDSEKHDFLGHACALIAPYGHPESFCYEIVESLACGTPVIAYRNGSMTELLDDGVTGVLCRSFEDLLAAPNLVQLLSRHDCRLAFESRFTVERMAQEYVEVYGHLLGRPVPSELLQPSEATGLACIKQA
ncbi:MAG: glycosyltransferase family 4 protein [Nitrospira sp.]|nr:glycosyltransferase family 4 protein [Nitrospira sp.]